MKQKILFIMTGSISCYKVCEAISKLRQTYSVQVVMTKSATQFVGSATLEALTGLPVLTDTFEPSKALHHISEVRNSDIIVIAPATANFIAKISNGIGDDLASTMMLAHDFKKPVILAPAMNTFMWKNPATRENVEKLKKRDLIILDPVDGTLACGEQGQGKLVHPDVIVDNVVNQLTTKNYKRVLITSGGTQELIDDVRVLTNKSSGQTGAIIADYLFNQGYDVTFLSAKNGKRPKNSLIKQISFQTFSNLKESMEKELSSTFYDFVIHSAAVSDFSVKPAKGKLSSNKVPQLDFVKNIKIIDQLKNWSKNKSVKVVGFKLTAQSSEADQLIAVQKVLTNSKADYVVVNDISQIAKDVHPTKIYDQNEKVLLSGNSKHELAKNLSKVLKDF